MPITLDVRLDGFDQPIGHMFGDDRGAVAFAYRPDYVARPNAMAISMSLPLSETGYGDPPTRAYFDNLLQERDTARADIIAKYDIANDDIAGILLHLGKDCSGAISVLPEGAPAIKVPGDLSADYVPLADDRLIAIIQSLHERRALP
jgi:serine/threonine-protein kinase HipA